MVEVLGYAPRLISVCGLKFKHFFNKTKGHIYIYNFIHISYSYVFLSTWCAISHIKNILIYLNIYFYFYFYRP
jgi:hypothetical protein